MSYQTLPPGIRFGAYEIVAVLGRGAFGTVYEALRLPIRKRVALKLLNPDMVDTPEAVARFLREAETGAQFQHPHIVDVQDLGSFDGIPFLAMEFLSGETLEDRIEREGRLSVETAVDLLLPVISAVAAVHDLGVVHRDLKPANVLITQGPQGDFPKLLDFGIMKVQHADISLTRTATLLGTPSFMAPEQVREAKDIDARADLWSLAVMLYNCVTGAVPFIGGSMFETFDQVMHAPIVPPSERVRNVPSGFDAVLLRGMKRESSARIATAREFGAALLPFASPAARSAWSKDFRRTTSDRPPMSHASLASRAKTPPVQTPTLQETIAVTPPRSTRAAWALSVAAMVLVSLVGATVLRARPQAPDERNAILRWPLRHVLRRPVVIVAPATPAPPVTGEIEGEESEPASATPHRHRTPRPEPTPSSEIGNY